MAHMRLFLLSSSPPPPSRKTRLCSPTFKFGHVAENGTLQNWALENKVKIEKRKKKKKTIKNIYFSSVFLKFISWFFRLYCLPRHWVVSFLRKFIKWFFFFFHLYLFLLPFFYLLYPFLIKKSRKRWNENNKTGKKKREKRFVWGNEFLNC